MGGNQTSQKGNIANVFEYFDEEISTWSTTSKNLKEAWESNDREWVPRYLLDQMNETEKRWMNIKSMIVPPRENVKERGKDVSSYQDMSQHNDERIKQLEQNNETLLQKNQSLENELATLKSTKCHIDGQGSPSKLSKPVDKKSMGSDVNSSEWEEEKANLIRENDKLRNELKSLNARANDLEKDKVEVNEKSSKHMHTPESDSMKTETQQNKKQQANNENKASNDISEKQIKQTDEKEEKKILTNRNEELQEKADTHHVDLRTTVDRGRRNQQFEGNIMKKPGNDKLNKESVTYSNEDNLRNKRHNTVELREKIDMLKAKNDSLETCVLKLTEENNELLLRLSRFAGEKLLENNPAITDLSDPNRPTRLAEYYSDLYDNEWTNAFEALAAAGYDEVTAIKTLRLTLENVLQFCEGKAELLLRKVSDAVNLLFKEYQQTVLAMNVPSHLTLPRQHGNEMGKYMRRDKSSLDEIVLQRMWKPKCEKENKDSSSGKELKTDDVKIEAEEKLKTLRKEMASTMVPIVQKAYIEASWTNECIDEIKPYILKCLYLGWMMKVQSPPMVFRQCATEVSFDRNVYKEYLTSGPLVNFVVWPALLLHSDGPLVCKGVAEGKKSP